MDQSGNEIPAPDYRALAFRLKLGIAIAIIRRKPPNKTALEYTESLIARYRCRIQDCERKLENANREILTLKQRLSLSQAGVGKDADAIFPTPESQGVEEWAARCDAVPSLPVVRPDCDTDVLQHLHSDAAFLSCALHRQASSMAVGTRLQGRQLLRDTMVQSTHTLAAGLREGRGVTTSPVFKEVVSLVIKAADEHKFAMDRDFKASFQELFSAVLERILKTDALDEKNETALSALQGLLSQTSRSKWLPLVLLEVESLLEAISAWCGRARAARLGGQGLPDIQESENIILVASVLVATIRSREDVFGGAGVVCRDIATCLEDCLLHLVTSWPLLARVLWQISAMLHRYWSPPLERQPCLQHREDW